MTFLIKFASIIYWNAESKERKRSAEAIGEFRTGEFSHITQFDSRQRTAIKRPEKTRTGYSTRTVCFAEARFQASNLELVRFIDSRLQNLDKSEIYCLFCIENKTRLVNLIIKMYYKLKENKDLVFGLSTDDSEKLQMSLNISDIEKPLEDDFFTRTEKNYPKRKNKEFNNAEKVNIAMK